MSVDEGRSLFRSFTVCPVGVIVTARAQRGWFCILSVSGISRKQRHTWSKPVSGITSVAKGLWAKNDPEWKAFSGPLGPPWTTWGHCLRQALGDQIRIWCYLHKHAGINTFCITLLRILWKMAPFSVSGNWILSTLKLMQESLFTDWSHNFIMRTSYTFQIIWNTVYI